MRRILTLSAAVAVLSLVPGCKGDPNTPEYWEKALTGSKKTKEKIRVVQDLRESKKATAAFLPMLHNQLGSQKHPEVKAEIARLLAEAKDPSSVQPLTDALDPGNTDSAGNTMNKEIASALGAIGDKKAVPTLLRLLKARDNYVKIEAINALGALRAPEAVDPLMAIATDEQGEPFISKKAIQALGEIGDKKSVPALVKMMFKERRQVSFYVESSFGLYQIGQPAADALVPLIRAEDKDMLSWAKDNNVIEPALYAKAAQVLGDLHDARAEKAIVDKLKFESDFLDVKLFVRMRMADALGRIRSREAAKVLATMLDEEEANARQEYIRALIRIGSPEVTPALVKVASKGSWDAREPAIVGIAMLGGEKELAAFDKLEKDEEALTTAECKDNPDYAGCKEPAELTKKHLARIQGLRKRLEAAKECRDDSACWVKKLDDAEPGVRERAAYEIGRSKKGELISELMNRLTEKQLDTRLAIIQAADWLVHDSPEGAKKAATHAGALEKQIAEERGKTEFVKVNEDLRRLAVLIRRNSA